MICVGAINNKKEQFLVPICLMYIHTYVQLYVHVYTQMNYLDEQTLGKHSKVRT